MKKEMKLRRKIFRRYVALFNELKKETGSGREAYGLLREIHHDFPGAAIHASSRMIAELLEPADEDQVRILAELGLPAPLALTREQASRLIDQARKDRSRERAGCGS